MPFDPTPVTPVRDTDVHGLANLPSELLLQALEDLEWCEARADTYLIDMGTWHTPQDDGRCAVCLAGSVMARTLGADKKYMNAPANCASAAVRMKLCALDLARDGGLLEYLLHLDRQDDARSLADRYKRMLVGNISFVFPDYSQDPDKFKAGIRAMAAELARHGL